MAESFKQIKNRIRSIENIKKITRAMQMVSLAKLRPCENRLVASKNYCAKLKDLLRSVSGNCDVTDNPFLMPAKEKKKIALLVIGSDTGLCGTYNQNIFRQAEDFINEHKDLKFTLLAVGRKAFNYFKKRGVPLSFAYVQPQGNYAGVMLDKIIKEATDLFLSKEADALYLVYTHFISAARWSVVIDKLLNIEPGPPESREEYILEPDANTLLDKIVPAYISSVLKTALLEAKVSEHAARIISMSEATNNAEELLEDLVLLRNKVRQAGITKELIEIISSAEALKG